MPINNKVKSIYDTLKSGGADVGTEDEFNSWFFEKGDKGHNNRKSVFDTLKGGGADAGANYEEFRDWLGLHAVQPKQKAAPAPTQELPEIKQDWKPEGFGKIDVFDASQSKLQRSNKAKRQQEAVANALNGKATDEDEKIVKQEMKDQQLKAKMDLNTPMSDEQVKETQDYVRHEKDRMDYKAATGHELPNMFDSNSDDFVTLTNDFQDGKAKNNVVVAEPVRDENGNITGEIGWTSDRGATRADRDMRQELIDKTKQEIAEKEAKAHEISTEGKDEDIAESRKRMEEIGAKMAERQKQMGLDKPRIGVTPEILNDMLMGDEQYAAYAAALDEENLRMRSLQDRRNGGNDDYWWNVWRGIQSGLENMFGFHTATNTAKYKAANHISGYDNALDEAYQTLLESQYGKEHEQGVAAEQGGYAKTFGELTGNSVTFMPTFYVGGPLFKGINTMAKLGVRTVTGGAAKQMAKKGIANAMRKYAKRALGAAVSDNAVGFISAGTVGAPMTWEQAVKNYSGNLERDENGRLHYVGGDNIAHALTNAFLSTSFEYSSEMAGNHMESLWKDAKKGIAKSKAGLEISKLFKKAADNKTLQRYYNGIKDGVYSFATKVGNTKVGGAIGAVANVGYNGAKRYWKAAQIQGLPFEGLEEELNNVENALFQTGQGDWSDLVDPEQQFETWAGLAVSIGTTGAVAGTMANVGYGSRKIGEYRAKHAMDNADAVARFRLTADKWTPIKETLDQADNADMGKVVKDAFDKADNNIERKAILDYAKSLLKYRGYNIGSTMQQQETGMGADEGDVNYAEGYETTDAASMQKVKANLEAAKQRLNGFDLDEANAEDILGLSGTLNEDGTPVFSEEEIQAVVDYLNAKTRYDGMMQRVRDDMDNAEVTASANVDAITNKATGMVQSAKVQSAEPEGRAVHIIGGNLETKTDGSIDFEATSGSVIIRDDATGKIEMISPKDFISIDAAQDPEQLKAEAVQTVRETQAKAAADKIDNTPQYGVNDSFVMADGTQGTVQFVNADGVEVTDGKRVWVVPTDEFESNVASVTDANGQAKWQRNDQTQAQEQAQEPGETTAPEEAQEAQETAEPQETAVEEQQSGEVEDTPAEGENVPQSEAGALSRIPKDDKGEPMFEQADGETALAAIGELTGGNEANTEAIVNAQVEQANKELEALKKKQPKRTAPKLAGSPMAMIKAQQEADANYNAAMEQYNAQLDAAQKKADAWNGMAGLMRDKAAAKLEEDKRIAAEQAAGQAAQTEQNPTENVQETTESVPNPTESVPEAAEPVAVETAEDSKPAEAAPKTEVKAEQSAEKQDVIPEEGENVTQKEATADNGSYVNPEVQNHDWDQYKKGDIFDYEGWKMRYVFTERDKNGRVIGPVVEYLDENGNPIGRESVPPLMFLEHYKKVEPAAEAKTETKPAAEEGELDNAQRIERRREKILSHMGDKYSLSDERADNGEAFIQNEEGSTNLAKIPDEIFDRIGIAPVPFKLTETMGWHVYDHHQIEAKLQSVSDAVDFVLSIINNVDHVRLGRDNSYIFSVENKRDKIGRRAVTIMINSKTGEFMGIKTSGYESIKKLQERPLLWERGADAAPEDVATPTITTIEPQQGDERTSRTKGQSNVSSESKNTDNSEKLQEKGEKNATAEAKTETDKAKSAEKKKKERQERLNAAREVLKRRGRYYKENAALGAYYDFNDFVMRGIATGRYKFKWGDKSGSQGLGAHLGFGKSGTERNSRIWLLSKDGYTPEEAAEKMLEDYAGEVGYSSIDSIEALGIILDVIREYSSPRKMMDDVIANHAEPKESEDERRMREEYEYNKFVEAYHMTPEEYNEYKDVYLPQYLEEVANIPQEDIDETIVNSEEQKRENVENNGNEKGKADKSSKSVQGERTGEQVGNRSGENTGGKNGSGSRNADEGRPLLEGTSRGEVSEAEEASGKDAENEPIIKGKKWEATNIPEKFKSGKKADSHDVTWYIGKKRYGSTTSERDEIEVLRDEYNGYIPLWNAYEKGEITLSPNAAAIVKDVIKENENQHTETKKAESKSAEATKKSDIAETKSKYHKKYWVIEKPTDAQKNLTLYTTVDKDGNLIMDVLDESGNNVQTNRGKTPEFFERYMEKVGLVPGSNVKESPKTTETIKEKAPKETVSPSEKRFGDSVVPDDADTNIRQKLETRKAAYKKAPNRTRGFITNISVDLGLEQHEASQYGEFTAKNGKKFTFRISNHNTDARTFDENGEDEGISLVISSKKNKGIRGKEEAKAHVKEFFYPKKAIENAEGKPLATIIESIEDMLDTGEYVDKTGLAKPDETNAPKQAKVEAKKLDNGEITDVGEKIGGARKDLYAEMQALAKENSQKSDEDLKSWIAKLPVSKIFNFDLARLRADGLSNEAATFIQFVKGYCPAKPRTDKWKLRMWLNNALTLYRLCLEAMVDFPKVQSAMKDRLSNSTIGEYDALLAIGGFDSGLHLPKGTALEQQGEGDTMWMRDKGEVSLAGKWVVKTTDAFSNLQVYDTYEEAVDALKNLAGQNAVAGKKEMQFNVYRSTADGTCYITPKGKSEVVIAEGFKTSTEAFNYIREHNAELQERYRALMSDTSVKLGENRERKGRNWRDGKDVSAEDFRQTFGFRGVEFGNWMTQADRAKALNECYDALMDLADVCGVSPLALSLDGKLGMAFGARGGGNANAHYEPAKNVINLTKTKGAGSLAHEWFHAMDAYFARMGGAEVGKHATSLEGIEPKGLRVINTRNGKVYWSGTKRGYLTEAEYEAELAKHPVRKEIAEAWKQLVKAIETSAYGKRSKSYASLHSKYWSEPTEMGARAFSVWVENELSKRNATNDYLANNPGLLEEALGDTDKRYCPYPFNTDAEWMDEAFGNLFSTMQEKVDAETGHHVLYHKSEGVAPLSREERLLRDVEIEHARAAGLDVITDEEGQRVLDLANGKGVRLHAKQKRALETVSVSRDEEHQQTVISSADGAKILNNLDTLVKDYENSSRTKEKTFIGTVAKALGAERHGSKSEYATFETVNGKIVTIRLGNHNAKVSNFDNRGEKEGISIVVSPKENNGIIDDGDAHVMEYFYDAIKLRRAEGKPLAEIVKSIKQALYSGEYKDTTGLAEPQEVNAPVQTKGIRFFRTASGEAYGFTVGGKIYIDTRIANAETPVHEYAHMWASVLRANNPQEWSNIVELMKGSGIWDEVKERYPELKTDDEIADEVLAHYSGRRGAERLREEARKIAEGNGSVFEKAEAISALERVKQALQKFWKGVCDFLHIHYTSAEEVADRVMHDFLGGVDPRQFGEVDGRERYQFVGEKGAANADHAEEVTTRIDNLKVAREMEEAKKDAKAIKMATGWERGADGKWRYEIPDFKLKGIHMQDKELPLGEYIDAPDLFKAYPELTATKVRIVYDEGNDAYGWFVEPNNTITINRAHVLTAKLHRSVIAHEVQHAIQFIEGFALGGNEQMFDNAKAVVRSIHDFVDRELDFYAHSRGVPTWEEWFDETSPQEIKTELKKILAKRKDFAPCYIYIEHAGFDAEDREALKSLLDEANEEIDEEWRNIGYMGYLDSSTAYLRLAGEVESRNVQERLNMTPEERRASLAAETEDVSREDQIFLFGEGGESHMGTRTNKHMAEIGAHYEGKTLTDEERAVVDVYSGKKDRETVVLTNKDGSSIQLEMQQGNEPNAGTRHSIFRHVGKNNGSISYDEIILIPDIVKTGERTDKGANVIYQKKIDGVRYIVYTDKKSNKELFHDFYSNRKTAVSKSLSGESTNTQSSARTSDNALSAANVGRNSETASDEDDLFRTSDEIDAEYPNWLEGTTNDNGKHTTQVAGTVGTYRKVGAWIESNLGKDAKILDASSGMGLGTKELRGQGFNIEDVEPYQSEERKASNPATYSSYGDIEGRYDFIISNAVLNVIPDNWRRDVLHDMAARLKDGGKLFINTRKAGEEKGIKDKIELDSPQEVLVKRNGRIASYQRFFTPQELKQWVADELGEGYSVEVANERNSGTKGLAAVVVTKEAKAEASQMEQEARKLAELLHLDNIDFVSDGSAFEGKKARAKGWYSRSTGRITVVVGNHASVVDIMQTVLHEAVAHYGLRKMFGEHFDSFLDNVYNNADGKVKEAIDALAGQYNGNIRTATEEYLASLAENTNFEEVKGSSWWQSVKKFFMDMLRALGFDYNGPALGDNELRYILWRSFENLRNPGPRGIFAEAEDIARQSGLKVGNYAEKQNGSTTEDLFRDGDLPDYEKTLARDRYERAVKKGVFQMREALQDSMLSLREAMLDIVQAETGKRGHIEDIAGFENAYLGENRLSSQNSAEMQQFAQDVFAPMLEEVANLAKTADERAELTDYMMAKHGLERNEVMARRAAQKQAAEEFKDELRKAEKRVANNPMDQSALDALDDVKDRMHDREEDLFFDNRGKDYAGLTALTEESDLAKAEAEARNMVDAYENAHDVSELWNTVNRTNAETLRKTYECGIISKAVYDDIRGMYRNYIPLRGFDEKTSGEVYAYILHKDSAFNSPIKTAKGRKSKADDPFVAMAGMAESAIMQGNRNVLVKQKFMNFVMNHPSDLVSMQDIWLEFNDATGEWQLVTPDIKETDTPAEIEKKIEDFDSKMKGLKAKNPDKYKHGKETQEIPYRVVEKRDLKQHQVLVKRNGRDYILTINGSPRAAQALNGQTNPDNVQNKYGQFLANTFGTMNRWLSLAYTSRNPDFVVSNFLRDAVYANLSLHVKESQNYAMVYHAYFLRVNPYVMARLYAKLGNGKLDMNNRIERSFYEFYKNGGETGYTNMRNDEKRRKEINRELAKYNGKMPVGKALEGFGEALDDLNRAVENCARFATYMTSRRFGRTIDRSIYDAKEVSVNFNKKGAGSTFFGANGQTRLGNISAFSSATGRSLFLFWNAALQGTTNFGRQVKRNPGKALAIVAVMFAAGMLAAGMGGDDGDDDGNSNGYYNLPENTRRTNILFKRGDYWISIPLPVEYRAIYGLGELAVSTMRGKGAKNAEELTYEAMRQMSQVMPLDMLEGDGGAMNLIPGWGKPIVEAYVFNKSWTGLPIYKDNDYNQDMPEYKKAYKNASTLLVAASKELNEATGGDAYTKGKVDINPAKLEHVLNGYLGGMYGLVDKLVKSGETMIGTRDFEPKNIPLVNRVVKQGDERTAYRKYKEDYHEMSKEAKRITDRVRGYRFDTAHGIFDYAEKLHYLEKSPEYTKALMFNSYDQLVKAKQQLLNMSADKEEQKRLQREVDEAMKQVVDAVNAVGNNDKDEGKK
jgi:hypothetical protein